MQHTTGDSISGQTLPPYFLIQLSPGDIYSDLSIDESVPLGLKSDIMEMFQRHGAASKKATLESWADDKSYPHLRY